jgi:biotin carboxylase
MKPTAIFMTDPYAGGVALAEYCLSRRIECHAVHSQGREIPEVFRASYRAELFASELWYEGDLNALAGRLRDRGVAAGVVGTETGVELNDALTEKLGLPTNGTALSPARRNKFLMIERLRAAGLPVADQALCRTPAEAAAWFSRTGQRRVVCKPLTSAGTDGVSFHQTPGSLRDAAERLLGRPNRLGGFNEAVLVQEYLEGAEYVVDTVSCAGRHYVTAQWRYAKRHGGGAPVYEGVRLLPARGPEQDELAAYALRVLDALGIRYGAGHHEIMYTARGPVAVESAARSHGGTASSIAHACTGHSQTDLTLAAYTDAEQFALLCRKPYQLRKHARTVFLIAPAAGMLLDADRIEEIRRLPSCRGLTLRVGAGEPTSKTVDLFSSPGWADLIGTDEAVVARDEEHIRRLEGGGLYVGFKRQS